MDFSSVDGTIGYGSWGAALNIASELASYFTPANPLSFVLSLMAGASSELFSAGAPGITGGGGAKTSAFAVASSFFSDPPSLASPSFPSLPSFDSSFFSTFISISLRAYFSALLSFTFVDVYSFFAFFGVGGTGSDFYWFWGFFWCNFLPFLWCLITFSLFKLFWLIYVPSCYIVNCTSIFFY